MMQQSALKSHSQIARLGLGTVQFGQDYGIANKTGQVSKGEVFNILEYASQKGMDILDTAFAYGQSESILGEFFKTHRCMFKIVSKLSVGDQSRDKDIRDKFLNSLKNMNVKRIYGYLIHHFGDFMRHEYIWDVLEEFRREGLVGKIGFSLYHPEELEQILGKGLPFDIIQIPFSVFDRRFEKYFSVLKEKNIEIHVRSVFLQGLAFLNPDQLPEKLRSARGPLEALRTFCLKEGLEVSALCLNGVLLSEDVDKVIMGVDNLEHLKRNIHELDFMEKVGKIKEQWDIFRIDDEDILLPYRWR